MKVAIMAAIFLLGLMALVALFGTFAKEGAHDLHRMADVLPPA